MILAFEIKRRKMKILLIHPNIKNYITFETFQSCEKKMRLQIILEIFNNFVISLPIKKSSHQKPLKVNSFNFIILFSTEMFPKFKQLKNKINLSLCGYGNKI